MAVRLNRRQFIQQGLAGAGIASVPCGVSLLASSVSAQGARNAELAQFEKGFFTLNRISYGATLAEYQELNELGLRKYLELQLHPVDTADEICNARLEKATLHIEYKASDDKPPEKPSPENKSAKPSDKQPVGSYPAMNEDRPLRALNTPLSALWHLTDNSERIDNKERSRPLLEVKAATWIRARYSRWQLREMMVEFWHNHFNVAAGSQSQTSVAFPAYDAVIRRYCFGNFRALLEEVAQSPAMLFYLNNAKSKEGPANENYARELFELHTLGADFYFNSLYNRWREVPGAVRGHPIGYIDQDVYEAARAFTGWTVADGSNTGRGIIFPKTGDFTYFEGWHDNYQKRVLGTEFDPNAPPMADGKRVLDLVASHPGTARHLCTKLCRRFVGDSPPALLVKRASKVWMESQKKPDQIARVLRTILLSPEFLHSQGGKVKRPMEFVLSFLRATGGELMPNENLFGQMNGTGYRQFEWPTPTGHPDTAEFWLNTNTTLSQWNLIATLVAGGGKMATFDLAAQTPVSVRTSGDIVSYWVMRLTGRQPDASLLALLMQFMPRPGEIAYQPDLHNKDVREALQQMVTSIAMLPEFQWRG